MGGINSGRKRSVNRGAMEQFPSIDLRVLKRAGLIQFGECTYDTSYWQNQDLKALSVRILIDLSEQNDASIKIIRNVDGLERKEIITIECAPCPFGSHRCYFRCPINGERCEQLFFVDNVWASRKAHSLTYAVKSEDELSRARRKVRKLYRQVKGDSRYARPRGCNRMAKIKNLKMAKAEAHEIYRQRLFNMIEG